MIAPLQPGDPHQIGPYRLFGLVGSGGMGQVFVGLPADGQPVAVKVIRAELAADREFRTRFRHEVAAARKVSGKFTALVVDADVDGPVPWLATTYVAGPSLAEVVNNHGPLRVNKVLWLAAGLAESLIAIHAAGVIHRDLKPSNVLLAEDGPRVIDFGIAVASWANAMPGADFGSPSFMSPEHALGHAVGPASDIFSLGAVLTFAASGQGPFGSGSSTALIYRLVHSPARLDALPGELQTLVGSCLAKHPADRPTASRLLTQVNAIQQQSGWLPGPTFNTFAQDQSAAGSVVEPRPASASRHPRRRFSRSLPLLIPGLLAALAAAIYLMSGGFASSPARLAQPQAGTATTPPAAQAQPQAADPAARSGSASHATVTHSRSRSARQDLTGPAVNQSLSATALLTPFALAPSSPSGSVVTTNTAPPSKSPSRSPSPSKSPSPSPSPSPSGSSPSPSPSPSSSSSATATSTPSQSPSSSTSSA